MPEGRILAGAVTMNAVDSKGNAAQYPLIIGGNTGRTGTFSASSMVYESGTFNGWVTGPDVAPDLPEARGNRPAVGIIGPFCLRRSRLELEHPTFACGKVERSARWPV